VFPHVPGKFFDLITFELKAFDGMDVTSVFEALSHRRAATQAYRWLHVPAGEESNDDLIALLTGIEEEASRHGVGMIVGADPQTTRRGTGGSEQLVFEPDPESLNEFIAQQLNGPSMRPKPGSPGQYNSLRLYARSVSQGERNATCGCAGNASPWMWRKLPEACVHSQVCRTSSTSSP
jgi:hypothetical protein